MERNFYATRLFPCWVMASQQPFKDDVGGAALLDAMNNAVARAHFKEVRHCTASADGFYICRFLVSKCFFRFFIFVSTLPR